jgi:hypothetical protein
MRQLDKGNRRTEACLLSSWCRVLNPKSKGECGRGHHRDGSENCQTFLVVSVLDGAIAKKGFERFECMAGGAQCRNRRWRAQRVP